jgi:hypothetical protein
MGFLAVDQVVLKSKGIIRLDGNFVFRPAATQIVINMGGKMVDYHDHTPGQSRFGGFPLDFSFLQELAQTGDLSYVEIVCAGTLEEFLLRANYEGKLIVSVRLNFSDLTDQIYHGAPG